jgi:hypothetical protein
MPDADSRYPVLTQEVEGNFQTPVLAAPGAVPVRRTREVVAAVIAVLALVAVGAYLYLPMPRNILGSSLSRDAAIGVGGSAGTREALTPTKPDPTGAGPNPSERAEATRAALAEAIDAATRALAVKPGAPAGAGAGAPAHDPVDVAPRPKATPAANTTLSTSAQRANARGTMPSANAAAALPPPSPVEPARRPPEQFGPCTATVAALGLCTTPPIQSKE